MNAKLMCAGVSALLVLTAMSPASAQVRQLTWTQWIALNLRPETGRQVDTDGNRIPDRVEFDRNGDTDADALLLDVGHGAYDSVWIDSNFNGKYDTFLSSARAWRVAGPGGYVVMSTDINEDGMPERAGYDSNGDGHFETDFMPVVNATLQSVRALVNAAVAAREHQVAAAAAATAQQQQQHQRDIQSVNDGIVAHGLNAQILRDRNRITDQANQDALQALRDQRAQNERNLAESARRAADDRAAAARAESERSAQRAAADAARRNADAARSRSSN